MATQIRLAALLSGLTLTLARSAHAALLYGMDAETDNLVTINTRTGAVGVVGNLPMSGTSFGGLDFDSSGQLYVMRSNGQLLRVDAHDASGVPVGPQRDTVFESFEIIGNKAYAAANEAQTLYEVNLHTGAATLVGSQSGPEGVVGLASSRGVLYGTRFFSKDIVQLNRTTGAIDQVIGVHGLSGLTSLAFADGVFWGIPARTNDLYSIDPRNGVATLIYGDLANVPHITGLTAAVPEPDALALAMVGVPLLLALVQRIRQHHQ